MKPALKKSGAEAAPARQSVDAGSLSLEDRIRYHLYESGERDRLKQVLAQRLESCGWKDDIKKRSQDYIAKRGRNNVTIEDVVRAVRPEGRATVPDSVKAELLSEIKKFIGSL